MTEYKVGLNRTDLDILEVEGLQIILEDMSTLSIEMDD